MPTVSLPLPAAPTTEGCLSLGLPQPASIASAATATVTRRITRRVMCSDSLSIARRHCPKVGVSFLDCPIGRDMAVDRLLRVVAGHGSVLGRSSQLPILPKHQ